MFRPSAREERDDKARESSIYYYTLPDEFVRRQMAVGALVLFGVLRVICAAVSAQHSWCMSTVLFACLNSWMW
ncbi:MAG: unnamed protein product [uncultured Caballeronia sp.]|nr:MAG: unnamed protein product [uncultured Caballeronia sp.]